MKFMQLVGYNTEYDLLLVKLSVVLRWWTAMTHSYILKLIIFQVI